jgi:membrane-associated phospholipid phosphatase
VQLLKERQIGAYQAAQVLAVLGLALSDAFVTFWSSKFEINLLRPVTYIQQYLDQPQWKPLLTTPPFPEYPSGHSVGSGAAAEVLEALLGPGQFTDQTHVLRGQKASSFPSFRAAADEAGISRLYGGIHYRDAIEQGLAQGRCVGQTVMNRLE